MKKSLLALAFFTIITTGIAQIVLTTPVPKYGCPNTSHNVTVGVKNTTGFTIPAGFITGITTTIKNNVGTVLKTNTQSYAAAVLNGDTAFVTIPSIPFQGAMICNIDISVNYTLPSPGSYTTTGTYVVQTPQDLVIQENPVGTLESVTALDSYSVRYYKNAVYTSYMNQSITGIYTPSVSGSYTAKAYEPISGCKSANASNAVAIAVVASTLESQKINISVYPNPMASSLTISTGLTNPLTYELFDINGSSVRKSDFTSVANMSVENLKAGAYVLVIKENGQQVASYQLVK